MSNTDILDQALKLRPEERFIVVEGLLKSLDVPDEKIDDVWTQEAENRLKAYREGKLEAIPLEEVFKADL